MENRKNKQLTYNDTYTKFSTEELTKMQKALEQKKSVTIPEAGILWEASPNTIFKMLNKGLLVGYHPFGSKHTRIDVAKSNEILEKWKNDNLYVPN